MQIRKPDDMHVHFWDGDVMRHVLPYTARVFGRAVVMPNLSRPVVTANHVISYRTRLMEACSMRFQPLMTFYLNDRVLPETIPGLKKAGAVAGKYYPEGVTTGAEYGVEDINSLYPVMDAMQEHGLLLLIHGERPETQVLQRETAFIDTMRVLCRRFPRLRMVFEHITTWRTVQWIEHEAPDTVAATITAHHLVLTLDDVVGGKLNPAAFCKPIPKTRGDQQSLIQAAISGHPRFFFGSDSAPHTQSAKILSGCAGIFSAPCAFEILAAIFDRFDALDKLEDFTSRFGAEFYGLPRNRARVELVRDPWVVPRSTYTDKDGGIVPFMAGRSLPFSVR